MNPAKEFFIAGLKLVGVLNIVWGFVSVSNQLLSFLTRVFLDGNRFGPTGQLWREFIWMVGPVLQTVIGVYLLINGKYLIKLAFRNDELDNLNYACKKCGGIFPKSEWEKITENYSVPEGSLVCPNLGCTSLNTLEELSRTEWKQ